VSEELRVAQAVVHGCKVVHVCPAGAQAIFWKSVVVVCAPDRPPYFVNSDGVVIPLAFATAKTA
jgi:hypothetical protein